MVDFNGKNVLVTGGTGLIGIPLCRELLARGARLRVASLDDPSRAPVGSEFHQIDLTEKSNCLKMCADMDFVFHLAGIKGSPRMCQEKPASFFYPTVAFNTHMLEAARLMGVQRYMFTSSVGVYAPAAIFEEDSVWSTFPSENDRFAGWAKRMGELQLEAYRREYGWEHLYCVRPANVFGPFDNFDPNNAMVIPSLIHRLAAGEDPFVVWGDGSVIRDFIFSEDCARAILHVFDHELKGAVNLGSGSGISIRELVETLFSVTKTDREVIWDVSKPQGDSKRILNSNRLFESGFKAKYSLAAALEKTWQWYQTHRDQAELRYNVFAG